jgi:hypothetical protein
MCYEISEKSNRFCKYCGKELGYLEHHCKNGKIQKRRLFSNLPYTLYNKQYYRITCFDCFYKEFGRLPKRTLTKDYNFMLGLPIELIEKR